MTAETAVALPGVVILVTGLLALPIAVGVQARCDDAAREAARAVARGDDATAAARGVDSSARVAVTRTNGLVEVDVTTAARLPVVGAIDVRAHAVTADELSATLP